MLFYRADVLEKRIIYTDQMHYVSINYVNAKGLPERGNGEYCIYSGVACLSAARGGPRICRPLLLHDPFPSRPPPPPPSIRHCAYTSKRHEANALTDA